MGSEPFQEASFDTVEGAAFGKSTGLLFLDTCSLLDLVRDLTRDSKIRDTLIEADRLWSTVVRGGIDVLMPLQVVVELDRHRERLVDDARKRLGSHFNDRRETDGALVALGWPIEGASLSRQAARRAADEITTLRVQRLDEWCAYAKVIEPGSGTLLKAVSRLNQRVAPSHADKSEFPDCLIIETVFAECESRGVEETSRAVFLSSNVQDYCAGASTRLKPPLGFEFQERRLHFASTFGYAAHLIAGDE